MKPSSLLKSKMSGPNAAIITRIGIASAAAVWLVATAFSANASDLSFKPGEEKGYYQFDTGTLRGKIRLNGKSQGIIEIVHARSGVAVAQGASRGIYGPAEIRA